MRSVHIRYKKCQSYPQRTQNMSDQFSVGGDQITLSRVGQIVKRNLFRNDILSRRYYGIIKLMTRRSCLPVVNGGVPQNEVEIDPV
jgi:hypothetical protein